MKLKNSTFLLAFGGILPRLCRGGSPPLCAVQCWENSKYVSKCLNDSTCLCSETSYQNVSFTWNGNSAIHPNIASCEHHFIQLTLLEAVYQCIYAQCDTARFGTALHYSITQCTVSALDLHRVLPPTLGRDELKKREADYVANRRDQLHEPGGGFPTQSVNGFPTQSIDGFPTQSAGGFLTQSIGDGVVPSLTAPGTGVMVTGTPSGFLSFTGIASQAHPSVAVFILLVVLGVYCVL